MRERFARNESQIIKIDEFDVKYCADEAIQWYTQDTFLYRELNKAIRTPDFDVSFAFRFYIRDIYKQLEKLYKEQESYLHTWKFYRGQLMQTREVERLTAGKIISVNSFFSTSMNKEVAIKYAGPPEESSGLVGVLFEIEVKTYQPPKNKPYAYISNCGSEEEEVLFMLGTVFRLKERKYDESKHLWNFALELCGEEDEDLKAAEISGEEEINKNDNSNSFYGLLCSLNNKIKSLQQQFSDGFDECTVDSLRDKSVSLVNKVWEGTEDPDAKSIQESQIQLVKQIYEDIETPPKEYIKKTFIHSLKVVAQLSGDVKDPIRKSEKENVLSISDSKTFNWCAQSLGNMIDNETENESKEEQKADMGLMAETLVQGVACVLHDLGIPSNEGITQNISEDGSNNSHSLVANLVEKIKGLGEQLLNTRSSLTISSRNAFPPLELD
ncbi:unnamed protein product [Rotaria sp. Silwood2]|nr:unnamed protein product [Rotaria sp. Silwood2]CAF4302006.1 unnamed protein product [Rotaria sp. Silwood2]